MARNKQSLNTEHPMALGSFRSWMRLIWHSDGIDWSYAPRLLFVTCTTLLTSPLRLWEWLRYARLIKATPIHPSPVFIIGHWRSGTTHLHNLMCQDENLGFLSTFQAMAPGFFLIGDRHIKPALARLAGRRYPTRLIDNIPLALDAPQEDEFAIAGLSPLSFLHAFTFPRQANSFFERYVLFRDVSKRVRAQWRNTYLRLVRKVTFASGGKRLVIKNCAHSGRIPTILELFPEAKFIHIHRNPYDVFVSTLHMRRTVLLRSQLQHMDDVSIEANVLHDYEKLMRRILEDTSLIPKEHLVEVQFEDLERAPLQVLQHIYQTLELPEFDDASQRFDHYIRSIGDYQKNAYQMDGKNIEKVNEHWLFALNALGYERLEPQSAKLEDQKQGV